MFTGIIETSGIITDLQKDQGNLHLTIASSISNELKIDQSVVHNGVCLTITDLQNEAADALQALNLTQTVLYLYQCNVNFENKYDLRGNAAAELNKLIPMRKLLPQVHAHYSIFVNLIEALQYLNPAQAPAVIEIIDRINQEIKSFNILIRTPKANVADAGGQF